MEWEIEFHEEFEPEFDALPQEVKDELLAAVEVLERVGPLAKRPHVDTLKGSKYGNMKELRFSAFGGVWRVAFAFDPLRQAILLVAGDKSGVSQKLFYRELIRKADTRYKSHLKNLEERKS